MHDDQRVVLVTGGGQGIGRAVAMDYAMRRFKVVIFDKDREAGEETWRELKAAGCDSLFVGTDVADEAQVRQGLKALEDAYGRLDILISNAGIGGSFGTPIETLPVEVFDQVIGVNLRGGFLCAKYGIPLLKRQGGSIIFIASTRAIMSEPHTEPYSASKGGLLALTHALAVSLSGTGIRVNAISPGWISTEAWQKAAHRSQPVFSDEDHRQHPAGRVGQPQDIAAACRFLTSLEAGFITGTNLVVDGGMTVKMIYHEG